MCENIRIKIMIMQLYPVAFCSLGRSSCGPVGWMCLPQNWGGVEHIRLQFVNREYTFLRSDICGTLNMPFFVCASAVCGFHVSCTMWTPVLGDLLIANHGILQLRLLWSKAGWSNCRACSLSNLRTVVAIHSLRSHRSWYSPIPQGGI
jgi:hypothetical protein